MKIKQIGLFLITALLLFGCPEPDAPPKQKEKEPEKPVTQATITFNMDGGSPSYVAVKVNKGSALGLQYPPIPVKSGFIFGGWYADDDTSYSNEYTKTTIINNDVTLKARWTAECIVAFNTDGGSAAPASIKIAAGLSIGDKFPPVPTKSANTFAGWFADTDVSHLSEYLKTTPINASVNLKAYWTPGAPPTWTVTFNGDGGTPVPSSINVPQGAIIGDLFPSTDPAKEDSAFAGWYNGDTRYDRDTAINSNVTLTAKWTPPASVEVSSYNGFAMGSKTKGVQFYSIKGKPNVLLVTPTSGDYEWNVMSYSLSPYIGKEITITMSMDVWVDTSVKIAWQVNNGSDAAAAWGGQSWKVIAGSNAPDSEIATGTWVHLEGSATGTPASGTNAGNTVYLSGGGDGGQLQNKSIPIYFANFVMTIDDGTAPPAPDPDIILLTIGSKINLTAQLNSSMSGKTITWSSADSTKVSVSAGGIVTSNITNFSTSDGSQKYTTGPAKAQVIITATAQDSTTQTFKVAATTQGQEDITIVTPFKSYFPAGILAGNIATTADAGSSSITNPSLNRHFNALTPENDMKPNALSNGRNASTGVITYTWDKADKFVNAATASGFKVIGHTLLWHQQIPAWQTNMASAGKETALAAMKQFITDVMTRYAGKIYSWDVLNEAFPDGGAGSDWKTAIRPENPWFKAIGSDFVYEAYLAARLADPNAKLYYNDYNTDQSGRATLIRNMVRDVNQRFKTDYPNETRLLIEGIGMQEHHNTGISAANIRSALSMFRDIGVKVSVSEIDVLGQDWGSFSSVGQGANKHANSTVTNNGLLTQADLYRQYMAVYMDFKDIIERISIWGITDDKSWRSAGLPLLFDDKGKAKPAYYKFTEAVTK